ncbi:diphosphomevalonate decarboxylase [Nocardia sp. NPDC020380]|uniref:diphosphomevalonate decarboxylase n=1 Tax=Nocardia sp. NPDC020380 TaxID=3364309 RepID=UPI0037A0F114
MNSVSPVPRTARAYPNIALIKYWGKRDELLHLPTTSSLSMTLDIFPTTTTVTVCDREFDEVILGDEPAPTDFAGKVSRFLDLVRDRAHDTRHAYVHTCNTVPLGAGLASSAAGFAALTVAATAAYGLDLKEPALTRLARRGSGSASRSICGGFAQWHRGEGDGTAGDESSFAETLDATRLNVALVVAVVSAREKPISSRAAMRRTMETSPFYLPWVKSSAEDLYRMRKAIYAGDLPVVGEVAERNALGMHATMLGARPAVRYFAPGSMQVLDRVLGLRDEGVPAYATMDAGPNVKVLCDRSDSSRVAADLAEIVGTEQVLVAHPGPAATLETA